MGFLRKSKRPNAEEDKKEKTKEELLKEVFEKTKDAKVDMKIVEEQAKAHPNQLILQGVKNSEEYQKRNYALYYSMQGEYEKSIEHATKGLEINPKSAYLFYIRGRSKGDIGKFEEGVTDLTNAIKIEPNYAEAFVERGYVRQKMGDFSGAKNDYDRGIRLDPSLQQQVNAYLNKKNTNEDMVIPSGVTFKFVVKPSIDENHQKDLKYMIIKQSGLQKYFKNIYVDYYDGSYVDKEGRSVSEDGQKGKQMLVKVLCPEAIVAIGKNHQEDFCKQIEEKFSKWIIDLIESNEQKKYSAELADFLYTYPMKLGQ